MNVWENGCSQGHETMKFGLGYDISKYGNKGADDFVVADGINFELGTVRLSVISPADVPLTSFDLKFFKNKNGNMPGEEVASVENITPVAQKFVMDSGFGLYQYEIELKLPETINFTEGTYWMQPMVSTEDNAEIYWDITVYGTIGGDYQIDRWDGNGWVPLGDGGFDAVFELTGNCTPIEVKVRPIAGQDETVMMNETLQLQAFVQGAISNNVNWSIIKGSELVSVNENGLLTGLQEGIATVRATDNQSSSFDDIEITVINPNNCTQEVNSKQHEEGYYTSGTQLAIDIDVAEGKQFSFSHIKSTTVNYSTSYAFKLYTDNHGFPGDEISSVNGTIIDDISTLSWEGTGYFGHEYTVQLDQPITLTQGKYWLEIITDAVALESTTQNVLGLPSAMNSGSGWTYSPTNSDFVYKILGNCTESLAASETANSTFAYYPNPVKDDLNIVSNKKITSVEIFNVAGQKVKQAKLIGGKVNTQHLLKGVYVVKALLEDGSIETFKIIKE